MAPIDLYYHITRSFHIQRKGHALKAKGQARRVPETKNWKISCNIIIHNTAVINKQINSQNFRDPFCFDFHKKNSRIFPTIASYFLFCLIKIKTKRITENSRTLPTSELCNKTIEVPICAFTTAEVYININIFFFYTDPNKKKEI